jgi:hypothetical protein
MSEEEMSTIPGELASINARLDDAERSTIGLNARMQSLETGMGGLREAVGYNTALTTEASGLTRQMADKVDKLGVHLTLLGELQERKTGQKWARRTVTGAGGIAAALTAIGVAAAGAWHWLGGGKP